MVARDNALCEKAQSLELVGVRLQANFDEQ
jgi:hypothetical protein